MEGQLLGFFSPHPHCANYFCFLVTELEPAERKRLPLCLSVMAEINILSVNYLYKAYRGICMHEHTKLLDTSKGIRTLTLLHCENALGS